MKVFVLVSIFEGVIEEVEVFESEVDAKKAWDDFRHNEYYSGTQIYKAKLIKKRKSS